MLKTQIQFAGAVSFNVDLCPWVQILPPSDKIMTITRSMFVATKCPVTTFSLLTDDYGSAFCYLCSSSAVPTNTTKEIATPGNIFELEYIPILTQEELQDAVDEYIQNTTNSSSVAAKYGHPISNWNVSLVTNFSHVFDTHRNPKLVTFVEDLDGWDTSSATAMTRMFAGASWFNGNISTWSTSRVTTMEGMFEDAFTFNGDISQWDTSSCTTMASMFAGADQFNGNLALFDTSNVVDMSDMFSSAISFEGVGLDQWNTSAVANMQGMFEQTFSFTADVLSSWDVSRVVDMSAMFQQSSFNGIIYDWNVTNVVLFNSMFGGAGAFNQDLSPWNVVSAVNFNGMVRDFFKYTCIYIYMICSMLMCTPVCSRNVLALVYDLFLSMKNSLPVRKDSIKTCVIGVHGLMPQRRMCTWPVCFYHPLVPIRVIPMWVGT